METKIYQSGKKLGFEEYMQQTKPVFIFGTDRSGTSLTYHIMNMHPNILKLPENSYFIKHFWKLRHSLPNKILIKILIDSSALGRPRPPEVKKDDAEDMRFREQLAGMMKTEDPVQLFGFISYIAYCRNRPDVHSKVVWWAERTNVHVYYYRLLKKWFPECKFIFCIREPRDVISSEVKRIQKQSPERKSMTGLCFAYSCNWVRRNTIGLLLREKYINDTFVNRYEDLISDPVSQINRLWSFMNLPGMPSEVILENIKKLGTVTSSRTDVRNPVGIYSESRGKWKKILSSEDSALIVRVTKKTAEKYGYVYNAAPGRFAAPITVRRNDSSAVKAKKLLMILLTAINSQRLFIIFDRIARRYSGIRSRFSRRRSNR